MKLYPLVVFVGLTIESSGQVIAGADIITVPRATDSGNSSAGFPSYETEVNTEATISYSLCLPKDIIPERNTKVSPFNYFSYGNSDEIFDGRFEMAPVVGVVRELSDSETTNYLAAMTEDLWFWWSRNGRRTDSFQVSGSPQLKVLCDTPEYKNAWVKFNGDFRPQQYPAYRIIDQRTGYALDSMLCAYPHNNKLIAGVVVEQQMFQGDEYDLQSLAYPHTCAALNVVQWGATKTLIYTTEPADASDDDSKVPINGPLTYLLAGTPASEPRDNPECRTTQNWFTPETNKSAKQIAGLNEVVESYPPDEFIEYCLGYIMDGNKLVRTVGLELGAIDYQWGVTGNPQVYAGHLDGGCFFPGPETVTPLPWLAPNHEENDDLWVRRYKTLTVPLRRGWGRYDPDQNPGSRVGCRSTLSDEDPVYLCRFHNPVTLASYVYGTYTLGNNGECKAIRLYQNENLQLVYGTTTSSVFQVYTGELDARNRTITETASTDTGERFSGGGVSAVTIPLGIIGLFVAAALL